MTRRQVVLDTETTGLETRDGHRVIEIGAVELLERRATGRTLHLYLNPDRLIDSEALAVHGISNDFLADKPRFGDVVDQLLAFIDDCELIIHNAEFDVGFLNYEFGLLGTGLAPVEKRAQVTDSLALAKKLHPGARNSLDALCRRYMVDNSSRDLHGALLDAQLLAEVYLRMTGGQTALELVSEDAAAIAVDLGEGGAVDLSVVRREATAHEKAAHEARLDQIEKVAGQVLWRT